MKTEARIQAEIFRWYHNTYCLPACSPRQMIFHVPNQNQLALNSIGLYPGVSDLVVIHNRIPYMIEVKEPEKGKQSDNQKRFQSHCIHSGIEYHIVTSLDEFKELVNRFA